MLAVAISLFAASPAMAKFGAKSLSVGSSSGPVDYLYTAGNTVAMRGWVDRKRYYRFDVYDASGAAHWSSACRTAPGNASVSGSYTLQSSDPVSNSSGWRFRLREFNTAGACNSSSSAQHDASLYFDVASATSYSSSALTSPQSMFKPGATAYVQVAGVGKVSSAGSNSALGLGSWSTTWLLPSGAVACANTANNASDLPGSTASGQLPDRTSLPSPALPSLQYRPSLSSGVDPWSLEANYEARPCQDFASTNQGQWYLLLGADSTHFVKLPVFSVATAPPVATVTSGPANGTSSTSATFTFTSSVPGSSFLCSLDGATPSSCSSPQTYSGLLSGSHTFSVSAVDPAGNVSTSPATRTWTVSLVAPTVTLSAPAAGSYTNNATPTVSGTAQTTAGDSNVTVAIYAGTNVAGTAIQTLSATVQSGGAWSVRAATLADGTYTVQAKQSDAASNTGYSAAQVFTVDTAPPAVTISSPANGVHTNDPMPWVSGTAGTASIDAGTVTVTVTGGSSPLLTTANVSASGAWSVSLPQSLADGSYTIQVTQQDLAGNTGKTSSQITIDTTPPQTFLDSGPTGSTGSSSASFTFHATDALSPAGSTFQCQLDGGAWTNCSSPQTYNELADGAHTFSVEAIDGVGNVDYTGQSDSWTINSALPAVRLATPAANSSTNSTTPTFSGTAGTATGDSGVQVLIYANTDLSGSPVQTLGATVAGDGSWSVKSAALSDGTYVAYAQQSNGAGTATSPANSFTVSTQPPTTTITLGPPGASSSGTASFSFISSAPGSSFQCRLDGGGWTACSSPQSYTGLANGSHTFQVRATDPAGNIGTVASQTWSVNTSLPALTLSAPSDGTSSNNSQLSIAGLGGTAAGDAVTVTVQLYSGTSLSGSPLETLTTTVSSATRAWTTHPSPSLADGTYTVYATQAGTAGTAYTQANTFTIDTVPPTTAIVSGPQGATASTSARFNFSSNKPGSSFQCQLDGGAWMACAPPQTYSSLAAGSHTFSVRATDPAGNVDPNPPFQAWTIDPTVPVTLTAPADDSSTNNTTPTFSGAANATDGAITVEIDDAGGNPVEVLTASQGSTWSVAAQTLADGTYTAFASQLASDGVSTEYSSVIGFTVDTTTPVVTLTTAPSGTVNSRTPGFGGAAGTAAGDQGTVTVKLYSGSSASGTPVQTISVTPSGGAWSATPAALPDGTYTVRAAQSDAAGNTGYSAGRTFTVDAAPPKTAITSGPSASTTATNASFSYSSSKTGSTFQCRLDGGAWITCASPQSYSSLAPGSHTFSVRATDLAGNVDPTPPSQSWTVVAGSGGSGGSGSGGNSGGSSSTHPTVQFVLSAKRAQHLGRKRTAKLVLVARCSSTCAVVLSGRLVFAGLRRHGHAARSRTIIVSRLLVTKVAGGKTIRLTVKLTGRIRKLIAAALNHHRAVTLTFTGVAAVAGMKSATAVVTIRVIL